VQAPILIFPVKYVPSLQSPVAPAGAPAGACAMQSCETTIADMSAIERIIVFIFPLSSDRIRINSAYERRRYYHSTWEYVSDKTTN
jgi:hypothetical protein